MILEILIFFFFFLVFKFEAEGCVRTCEGGCPPFYLAYGLGSLKHFADLERNDENRVRFYDVVFLAGQFSGYLNFSFFKL